MPIWSDIYFRCPCCRKRLVVERSAAGGEAPCPGCKAAVRIPRRSGLPPKLVRRTWLVAANVLVAAGVVFAALAWQNHRSAKLAATPLRKVSPLEKALAEKRPTPPAVMAADAKLAEQALADWRAKHGELAEKFAKLQTQYDGFAHWVLENYEGKYPLPLNLVSNLNLSPVTSNYTVGAEVAALLKMSDEEMQHVNVALESALVEMTRWEMAVAQLKESSADSASVVVPPFVKEGAAVKEQLLLNVEKALGGPRADKFSDVTRQQLDEAYNYFGAVPREVQFQIIPQNGDVPAYLLISDGWQIPDGDSVTRYSGKQFAVMTVPASYGTFIEHLPESIKELDRQNAQRN